VKAGGELEEVEVGEGNHDKVGLAAAPSTHVDIAVGAAALGGVHVEADAGVAFATGATASAGNVERDRDEVADIDEEDVLTLLDNFAGNLVAEDDAFGAVVRPRTMC
jgi:hypothetical protein